MQNAIDQKLSRRIRDADGIEDFVEVVRHEAVPGPLREERNGDDDPHSLEVAGFSDK